MSQPNDENKQGVMRREIRSAPPEFQDRFAAAVATMQINKTPGKNSSEWFRLAGYHGWPGKYCSHGREDFPTWHRAYLSEFERALQAADRENGKDGQIGLPYWDWTELGDEPFPNILNDPRLAQLPKDFWQEQPSGRGSVLLKPFKHNRSIGQRLLDADVKNLAYQATLASNYAQFASTAGGQVSIEDSHNSVHVACGFPMSAVDTAAFDAVFWLHHCNIDRFWQKYLSTHPNAPREAEALGKAIHEQNPRTPNRFHVDLRPFIHPVSNKAFSPAQAFTLDGLDYYYETLPADAKDTSKQLRQPPSYAVFQKIAITELNMETYQLHVFIVNKEWPAPDLATDPLQFHAIPNYAGMAAIFGGKEGCETCLSRVPFDVRVELTKALNQTDQSRYNVELFVIAIDSFDDPHALSDTPLPKPIIQGPMFENMAAELKITEEKSVDGEVRMMQEFLKANGFYDEEVDGWFGPVTTAALKAFQVSANLEPSGIADAATKKMMIVPKFDQTKPGKPTQPRKRGENLTYWVSECPGHLDRKQVLDEIQAAWNQWGEVTGTSWKLIDSWNDSDVEILWHDQHYHNELKKQNEQDVKLNDGDIDSLAIEFEFDGPGAQLGHSGYDFLHLDINEQWITSDMQKTHQTQFIVFNVVLHEIGHVLGLEHSKNAEDLMAPFYDDGNQKLQAGDIQAIQSLYLEPKPTATETAPESAAGSETATAIETTAVVSESKSATVHETTAAGHELVPMQTAPEALTDAVASETATTHETTAAPEVPDTSGAAADSETAATSETAAAPEATATSGASASETPTD